MTNLCRRRQRLVERFFYMNIIKLDFGNFRSEVLKMRIAPIVHGSHMPGFPIDVHICELKAAKPTLLDSFILSSRNSRLHYLHCAVVQKWMWFSIKRVWLQKFRACFVCNYIFSPLPQTIVSSYTYVKLTSWT